MFHRFLLSIYDQSTLRSITWYYQSEADNKVLSMLLAGVINTLSTNPQGQAKLCFGNYFLENTAKSISYLFDYSMKLEITYSNSIKYSKFLNMVEEDDFDTSITLIQDILIDKNQIASIFFDIGISKKREKKFKSAVFYLSKSLYFDNSLRFNIEIFHVRGLANYELKNYNEAISDFDAAIKLNPMNPDLYYCKGESIARLSDFDKQVLLQVVDAFSKCINLKPNDEQALLRRAYAFNSLTKYESAKLDFQRIIGINPKNKQALVGLSIIEHNLNLGRSQRPINNDFFRGNLN